MLFGAMNSPLRPVLDELAQIAELGFDFLELTLDPPEAHHATVRRMREPLLADLERRRMGLVVHLPTFVSTADLTESLRRASVTETLRSLELAADLGAIKCVLHPSFFRGLSVFVLDRARGHAMDSLEAFVERAGDLGMRLCLENMFPESNSLVEPEHFDEVFERFPGLGMALDVGHANIQDRGKGRAAACIERFGPRIDHIHASDNAGRGDDHLPVGAGSVDWLEIAAALAAAGFDGTVTFEVFSRDRDYLRISRDKFRVLMDKGPRT